ncbi:hypothetical protein [Catenuloplanes atrovinosus]|uniref:Uncharacterized protein n=1 Tax=Catenuloplanes atrovinosus TaxID=137266 RepID=A0AAE4CCM7_9ACTN|nr:hypothetical protein [Catenuloplanes atrovinosus]MDR7279791.1 hypothetical protein [Catenuloplanes atrovinosus]
MTNDESPDRLSHAPVEGPPRVPRWRTARLTVVGAIAVLGAIAFFHAAGTDRMDTALFFVLMPAAGAAALALARPRSGAGQVFVGVTILLLLSSVFLHEGVICVVLAAPLIYGMVGLVLGAITLARRSARRDPRRGLALLPVPLLVLTAGLEGVTPELRVDPVQTSSYTRTVALPLAEVKARIAAGPRRVQVRSLPLRALGVPMPEHIAGQGLEPGDLWVFNYHGSSHGPGGGLTTRVAEHGDGRLAFDIVANDSITARWMDFTGAELTWRAVDESHTEVRVALEYERGLDPSWYFGPLQDGLTTAGAGHFLDMLRLS